MPELVSRTRITASWPSQQNKQLKLVSKIGIKDGASKEAKMGVVSRRPVGWSDIAGAVTISLTQYIGKGKPEYDWQRLALSGEEGSITNSPVGGQAVQYLPCVVSKVEPSFDEKGDSTQEVEIICLGEPRDL